MTALLRIVGARAALLLGCAVVVFAATAALPGDALEIRSGGRLSDDELAALRADAGLDRPLPTRFAAWLGGLLTGDPGTSLVNGRPVAGLVLERLPVSATLAVGAVAVAVPLIAVLLWAGAVGPWALRAAVTTMTTTGAALPQVVLAAGLVLLLSRGLDVVPPVSLLPADRPAWARPDLLVLPVLTLALPTAAYAASLLRGVLQDVLHSPFIRDAVLRGVSPLNVGMRHVLPLLAAPALRVGAVSVGSLLAGTTVAETLFGLAGLGDLMVSAVGARDVPVVSAVALLAATAVVLGLLAADLVAVACDPRQRADRAQA